MLSHQIYQVNNTAVLLTNHSIFHFPTTVCVQNTSGSANVYLGGPTVSSSSYGFRIDPGQTFTAELGPEDYLYAIAGNGSTAPVAVMYLEQR
jgi:hypothetical protein